MNEGFLLDNFNRFMDCTSNTQSQKFYGPFVGTAGLGGGQESTAMAALSTWVHQGMIYVLQCYAKAMEDMSGLAEV